MEKILTYEEVKALYHLDNSFTKEHYNVLLKGIPIYYREVRFIFGLFTNGYNEVCLKDIFSVSVKKIDPDDIRGKSDQEILTAVEYIDKE